MSDRTYGTGIICIPGKRGVSWYATYIKPDGQRIRTKVTADSKTLGSLKTLVDDCRRGIRRSHILHISRVIPPS
jgi:hypothetical protein